MDSVAPDRSTTPRILQTLGSGVMARPRYTLAAARGGACGRHHRVGPPRRAGGMSPPLRAHSTSAAGFPPTDSRRLTAGSVHGPPAGNGRITVVGFGSPDKSSDPWEVPRIVVCVVGLAGVEVLTEAALERSHRAETCSPPPRNRLSSRVRRCDRARRRGQRPHRAIRCLLGLATQITPNPGRFPSYPRPSDIGTSACDSGHRLSIRAGGMSICGSDRACGVGPQYPGWSSLWNRE